MDLVRTVEHIEDISGVRWWLIVLLLMVSTAFPLLLAAEIVALGAIIGLQRFAPEDTGGAA